MNIKLMLLSFVAATGAIAAYPSNKGRFVGTTYYCVTDDNGGYKWVTVKPSASVFVCTLGPCYCSIVTNGSPNFVPQPNQCPNDTKLSSHSSQHSINIRKE